MTLPSNRAPGRDIPRPTACSLPPHRMHPVAPCSPGGSPFYVYLVQRPSQLIERWFEQGFAVVVAHVVLLGVGTGFLLAGLGMWNDQRPIENGLETRGRIVGQAVKEYTDADGHRQSDRYPIIEFTDRREATHRFEGQSHGFEGDTGDVVRVRYDPDKPSRAQWVDQPGRWLWMVFAGIGAVALLIELVLQCLRLRRRWVSRQP